MMRRTQAFRKQGVHRPTQSQRSFSGQASTGLPPTDDLLDNLPYPEIVDRRAAHQRLNKRSEFSCSSEGTFASLGG
jgi:hypothetical protein